MSLLKLAEGAAPPTPEANKVSLYAKTDGYLYYKDDQGNEIGPLGGGGVTSVTGSLPITSSGGATPVIGLDGSTANAGDVLTWDAQLSQWQPSAPVGSGAITSLTGDVTASGPGAAAATVTALQTYPVSATQPSPGDVLVWDGNTNAWVPTSMTTIFAAANLDAFGRLRVSAPETIFDSKTVYDTQDLYFTEYQTGQAPPGSLSTLNAAVTLFVPPGDRSLRQTRRYFTYQAGKSQFILQTFNLLGISPGVYKRAGYFDDDNGILLELDGVAQTPEAVLERRSQSATGTLRVSQSAWNLDTMDGNGPSGINLQWDKTQILCIDFEWLGVGSVRVGFVVDGQLIYAHRFDNANLNNTVYMSTPHLPVRWEVDASLSNSQAEIDCICVSVNSEGGVQATGTQYGFVMPALTPNVGSVAPNNVYTLLSIRHTGLFPRVTIIPVSVDPLAKSNGVSSWELVANATITNATWSNTEGYVDIDTAGTATGGTVIAAGTLANKTGAANLNLKDTTLTLGNTIYPDNNTPGEFDTLSLRVTNLSGGNENYLAAIAWLALT